MVLIWLLPLKFGATAALPEVPTFPPPDLISWLIFFWPPILFPVMSGILLAAVLALLPPPRHWRHDAWPVAAWILAAAAALLGGVHATVRDFVLMQWAHLLGLAAFAAALWRIIALRPDLRPWLAGAAVISTMMTATYGVYQYFWGFAETREFVMLEEARTGLTMTAGAFGTRLMENRVTATFAICNSFAAHLGLMLPFCLIALRQRLLLARVTLAVIASVIVWLSMSWWSTAMHQIGFSALYIAALTLAMLPCPERWQRRTGIVVAVAAGALLIAALLLTQSRAGLLALGIGLLVGVLLLPFPRIIRIAGATTVVIALLAGMWAVNAGRGLESLHVRLDYWRVAWRMMLAHPLTGAGWGEFFHDYTQLKQFPGTEAPHTPHNLVLAFAAQCGIPGLLAGIAALAAPLLLAWRTCRRTPPGTTAFPVNAAIFIGWCAWSAHAMADFNLQIAGTVATALLLVLLLESPDHTPATACPQVNSSRQAGRRLAIAWYALMIPLAIAATAIAWQRSCGESAYQTLTAICDPRFKTQDEYQRIPPAEMERALAAASARMPYSPFPWRTAMDFAVHRNAWPFAERCATEAVARSPKRASFHYHLAIARWQMGRHDEARISLRQAVALFPNHDGYRSLLARFEADDHSPIPLQEMLITP